MSVNPEQTAKGGEGPTPLSHVHVVSFWMTIAQSRSLPLPVTYFVASQLHCAAPDWATSYREEGAPLAVCTEIAATPSFHNC